MRGSSFARVLQLSEIEPFISDVKLNQFEIAYLTEEQVRLFRSDFQIVPNYFVQKGKNGDCKPSRERMEHVQAVLQLLSVMENDARLMKFIQLFFCLFHILKPVCSLCHPDIQ